MKKEPDFRHKTTVALLLIVLVAIIISYFLFTRLILLVHGDLYNYGLEYNTEWALNFWTNSNPFQITLIITAILIVLSIALIQFYAKRRVTLARNVCYLLLLVAALGSLFSLYFFSRIDFIINHDLYSYGLQFSVEWASNYWIYASSLSILMLTNMVLIPGSFTLLFLGSRKSVEMNLSKITILSLIGAGVASLAISIIDALDILALIGLGLVFWGITFTYVRSEEYIRKSIFDATVSSQQSTIIETLNILNYEGQPVYLPPKYFSNPETITLYLTKERNGKLPRFEFTEEGQTVPFSSDVSGIFLTPPGFGLIKIFEKNLKTNLTQVDLQFLQKHMPNLFTEELEICQQFEMKIEGNRVQVNITNLLVGNEKDTEEQTYETSSGMYPLTSAIACALAKTTGQMVSVEKVQRSDSTKDLTIDYRILSQE